VESVLASIREGYAGGEHATGDPRDLCFVATPSQGASWTAIVGRGTAADG
jgi:hypothetical protein